MVRYKENYAYVQYHFSLILTQSVMDTLDSTLWHAFRIAKSCLICLTVLCHENTVISRVDLELNMTFLEGLHRVLIVLTLAMAGYIGYGRLVPDKKFSLKRFALVGVLSLLLIWATWYVGTLVNQ